MIDEMHRVLKPDGLYIAIVDFFGRKIPRDVSNRRTNKERDFFIS